MDRARVLLLSFFTLQAASCFGPIPATPFEQAIAQKDTELVKEFLSTPGALKNLERPGYRTIVAAARGGQIEMLRLLAAAGADLDKPDTNGNRWTPLMHAIHTEQRESVRVLLELGAKPNTVAGKGWTALIMAAGYGDAETVRLLLAHGADPAAEANDGRTPLVAAVGGVSDLDNFTVGSCQTDTVKALIEANPTLRVEQKGVLRIARMAGCKELLALLK